MKPAIAIAVLVALPALGMRAQESDTARVLARSNFRQVHVDTTAVMK